MLAPIKVPGDCVSVDCLSSATKGLIAQISGTLTKQRYRHACVFVDHKSDLSYTHLLKTQSASELIEAKESFEAYADSFGVIIKHYHADNGIFKSRKWVDSCNAAKQGLTFAGVNGHHQNGRTERRIRSLQDMARTFMIHAAHRWPDAITANLWPYAIRAANDTVNNTPCAPLDYQLTPVQAFSGSTVDVNPIHWQPFGCPVYVLTEALQKNTFQNKWKERSRMGVYLGRSPSHARSVALVLNIETGRVSPQFHLVFDPSFHTTHPSTRRQLPESLWQAKCGFRGTPSLMTGNPVGGDPEEQEAEFISPTDNDAPREYGPVEAQDDSPQGEQADSGETEGEPEGDTPDDSPTDPLDPEPGGQGQARRAVRPPKPPKERPIDPFADSARRSTQGNKGERTVETYGDEYGTLGSNKALPAIVESEAPVAGELFSFAAMFQHRQGDTVTACSATSDPDTMYYHQAMKEPDSQDFIQAVKKEFGDLLANEVFHFVRRSSVPKDLSIFPAVWAMKRQCRVKTREVYKWKARLNLNGSKQVTG